MISALSLILAFQLVGEILSRALDLPLPGPVVGLCLLAYGVNLFIFSMGRLYVGAAPIMPKGGFVDPTAYADPLPQALVLTAIVISFATTALFLVVMIASRGITGTDHVDGRERSP